MVVLQILQCVAIACVITSLIEPLERLKERYKLYPEQQKSILMWLLTKPFSCSKCFSFWFSLLLYQDLFLSLTCAFLAEVAERKLLNRH